MAEALENHFGVEVPGRPAFVDETLAGYDALERLPLRSFELRPAA